MAVADGFFTHRGFINDIEGYSHFDEFLAIGHCTGATPSVLISLLLNALVYHDFAILLHQYRNVSHSCDTYRLMSVGNPTYRRILGSIPQHVDYPVSFPALW